MFTYPNGRLLIFAKAPLTGKVKTRLQPRLTPQQSAALHRHLIQYTLAVASEKHLCPVELWCDEPADPFFAECLQLHDVELRQQDNGDLGRRMSTALHDGLTRAGFAVMIGCDCPLLTAAYLQQACAALQQYDVVIGPAEDGGYVLIGSRIDAPQLFANIDWGSERVYAQTQERLQAGHVRWTQLATLWDIDRPADFERFTQLPAHCDWSQIFCSGKQA